MALELFDANYYQAHNPDLAEAGLTAPEQLFAHFQQFGLDEGRDFSPLVALDFYGAKNLDLKAAGLTTRQQLYEHLQAFGMSEGREFSPVVDLKFYQQNNADLANLSSAQLIEHLVTFGMGEGRQFSPVVDLKFYQQNNADLANFSPKELLEHLVTFGMGEMRKFSEAIDLKFYKDNNSDLASLTPKQAFKHLLAFGFKEGRKFAPNFTFDNTTGQLQVIDVGEGSAIAPPKPTPPESVPPVGDNSGSDTPGFDVGEPPPTSTMPEPMPPEPLFPIAEDIGVLGNTQTFDDSVSNAESKNSYRFSIDAASEVSAILNNLSTDANVSFLDSEGNKLREIGSEGTNQVILSSILQPGTYYLQVSGSEGDTDYQLSLGATAPTDIGTLSQPQTLSESVGATDPADGYSFTLDSTRIVNLTLYSSILGENAYAAIFDSKGNTLNGAVFPTRVGDLLEAGNFLATAGTYYVLVGRSQGVDANYTLNLETAAPTDLGNLSQPQTLSDSIISEPEPNNYYSITLDEASELSLKLYGFSSRTQLFVNIIDSNGNSTVVPGATTSDGASILLAAGTYYVRVNGSSGGGDYDLDLSATPKQIPAHNKVIMALELFDANYYQAHNPDLAEAGLTAPEQLFAHFQQFGLDEGRDFSPLVALDFYGAKNLDLKAAGLTTRQQLYEHLQAFGMSEGREFSPIVDLKFYQQNNADLANLSSAQLMEHLVTFGMGEGRQFSPVVDLKFYQQNNADLANFSPKELLEHLVTFGIGEMRQFSPTIDLKFYKDNNSDLASLTPKQAFEHLLSFGFAEGRKFAPNVTFDSTTGQLQGIDVGEGSAIAGLDPTPPQPPVGELSENPSPTDNIVVDNNQPGNNSPTETGESPSTPPESPIGDNTGSDISGGDVGEPPTSTTPETLPPELIPPIEDNTPPGSIPGDVGEPPTSTLPEPMPPELMPPGLNMPPGSNFPGNPDAPFPSPVPPPIQPRPIPPNFGSAIASDKFASDEPLTSPSIGRPILIDPTPPENAEDIGVLGNTQTFDDSVSNAEPTDSYRFSIDAASEVSAILDGLSAGANVNLLDSNGNYLNSAWGDGTTPALVGSILQPGTYYLQVSGNGGDTNYNLSLGATVPTDIGTLSQPQTLSESVGATDPADGYSFTLDATQEVNLTLNSSSGSANVNILDSKGNSLNSTSVDGTTPASASNLLAAGTYYVLVGGYGGADANYTLNLETAAPTELGNLSQPQTLSDSVSATDPNDYYSITLDEASELSMNLNGLSGGAAVNVLDSKGNYVAYAWGDATTPASASNLLKAGTYYVQVSGYGTDTAYDLNLSATPKAIPADDAGNTVGEAADLGTLGNTQTSIDWLGAVLDPTDYYRFTLDAASKVSLNLDNLDGGAYVSLLDSNEGYITSAYGDAQTPASKDKILQPGTYYVQLSGSGSDTSYDLNVSATPVSIPADAAGNTLEEAADLGTVSTAQTLSDGLYGGIDTTDFYGFTLDTASSVSLNVDNLTGAAYVNLLDSNGNNINSAWSDGTSAASVSNLLDAGSYYIQLSGYDSDTNYALNLSATPTPIPTDGAGNTTDEAMELGSLSAATTLSEWVGNPIDPTDYYHFTLDAAGEVNLAVDGLSGAAGLYLIDSNQQYIASAYSDAQTGASLSNSLEAGSYYVQVYGYGNNTNYNLNLSAV